MQEGTIWIPTVGVIVLWEGGSATLNGVELNKEEAARYRKMIDDYTSMTVCETGDYTGDR